MNRTLASFLFILLTPALSLSQVVSDTLDWHRYFPLDVGNEWQYYDAESGPSSRFVIRKDTLVEGNRYFIGRETFFAPDGSSQAVYPPREVYMRYDTSGVFAEFDSPDADTGFIPIEFERGQTSFPVVDLRTDFGMTVEHTDGTSESINVSGGYGRPLGFGDPEVVAAAEKVLSTDFWFWSFAADIGFIGGGNLWGPRLGYARVGGIEYGTVFLSIEENPVLERSRLSLSVYPNPTSNTLTVSLGTDDCGQCSILIFDAIGRRMNSSSVPSSGVPSHMTLDVSAMAPGLYFVSVRGVVDHPSLARPFLIAR